MSHNVRELTKNYEIMKSLFYPRHGRFPGKIPPDRHAVLVARC